MNDMGSNNITASAFQPENVNVSKRKKIMLAIDGLGLGGAEVVVRDMVHHIDPNRFDVCICCTKGLGEEIGVGEELLREGFDVFVLPGQSDDRTDYFTALKFRRAIIDRKIDIVHTHASAALFDAAPCRLVIPKIKLVHTFHYGNYPIKSWRHHVLEGLCARVADRLIAVGLEQRKQIQRTYKIADSHIATIWNGIKSPVAMRNESFRNDIATGDRILVGTIAKLIEQKGLDDLLEVARYCRVNGHNMQFVVVGEGPLRAALEKRRRELDLEDTVIITGWINNAAARVLPEFDIFFQPSRWEAMSIVILEAMASGIAIVATKVGDNSCVLEDTISGILVDSGDIEGMAEALIKVSDGVLRSRIGQAARASFEEKFTIEHMIRRYEQVYRDLIGC